MDADDKTLVPWTGMNAAGEQWPIYPDANTGAATAEGNLFGDYWTGPIGDARDWDFSAPLPVDAGDGCA